MTDDTKAYTAPGVEELVDLCPGVERDPEVVFLEDAIGSENVGVSQSELLSF